MAAVWLDEAGWEDGDVPDVCLECGRPAPDRVKKVFIYQPPWVWVTVLLGVLILVIVLMVTRKQFRARVPLCPEHKNHWRKRIFRDFGSFVLALLLAILGVALANLADDKAVAPLVLAVIMLCLIGCIVAVIVIHRGTIRATKVSNGSIHLTNVSPDFVEAYEDERDRQDERRHRRKARLDPIARQRWNESREERNTADAEETIRKDRPEGDLPPRSDKYRTE